MAQFICHEAVWPGVVEEDEHCLDEWDLPDEFTDEDPCCVCRYFVPDEDGPQTDGVVTDDGALEVYFEDMPRVVHVWTDKDYMCPKLNISRVIECRAELCGPPDGSLEYCWPTGCPYTILPPGKYRIRVPDQRVYQIPVGEEAAVHVLLEPVNDRYVQAIIASSAANGCCGESAIQNCCG